MTNLLLRLIFEIIVFIGLVWVWVDIVFVSYDLSIIHQIIVSTWFIGSMFQYYSRRIDKFLTADSDR